MSFIQLNSERLYRIPSIIKWITFQLLYSEKKMDKNQEWIHKLYATFKSNCINNIGDELNLDSIFEGTSLHKILLPIILELLEKEIKDNSQLLHQLFTTVWLEHLDRKKKAKIISRMSSCPYPEIKATLSLIKKSILTSSFYDLRDFDINNLIGEWEVTKTLNTPNIYLHSNHTDLFWAGGTLKVTIRKEMDEFYLFEVRGFAYDYARHDTSEITITKTLILNKGGYFNHYNYWSKQFIYKKPVYNLSASAFTTDFLEIEITLEKRNVC